jgi:hypothetical protein
MGVFIAWRLGWNCCRNENPSGNAIPGGYCHSTHASIVYAGFGLATGNWFYLVGALYLFFINSFICGTFLIVKRLHFQKRI